MQFQRNVKWTIRDNSYNLNCPTVGQVIDIETKKAIFSLGQYNSVIRSRTVMSEFALDLVDIAAYVHVLCPDFIKDLKTDFFQIDMFDAKLIIDSWKVQVQPWIETWSPILKAGGETKDSAGE